jgi:hypothetical protein
MIFYVQHSVAMKLHECYFSAVCKVSDIKKIEKGEHAKSPASQIKVRGKASKHGETIDVVKAHAHLVPVCKAKYRPMEDFQCKLVGKGKSAGAKWHEGSCHEGESHMKHKHLYVHLGEALQI